METKLEAEPVKVERVPLGALLLSFLKVGSTSFGGGNVAWMHREIVERRKWIDDDKFLQMLAIAQVMPGANPVNIAVYIGVRLHGFLGALMAVIGMIAMPFGLILVLGSVYRQLEDVRQAQLLLSGLACVGIASMLTTGFKSARRLRIHVVPVGIAACVFFLVGVLRWPMVWVVAVAMPVSIVAAYFLPEKKTNG